jgi:Uma2 family endonuclease
MPDLKKAELIEGVVYMPSPVRLRRHGSPHAEIVGWLTCYRAATPGVIVADNATARLGLDNITQPDALLMIDPDLGGKARISSDDYVEGAPELVVEVASSSVSLDLNLKFHVYRRSGIREYVVWRVQDRVIDWFVLQDGVFVRLDPDEKGLYRSLVFPGLWLDATSMLGGDLAKVLSVLSQGVASPEHHEFSKSLRESPLPPPG